MADHLYIRVESTGKINGEWSVIVANPDLGDPPLRMQAPTALLDLSVADFAAAGRKHTDLKTSRLSDEEHGRLIFDAAFPQG